LTVAVSGAEDLRPFADLVADEVNVKRVDFTPDVAAFSQRVLTVVPRVLGPRLGGQVQQVIKAVKAGDWSVTDGTGGTTGGGGIVTAGGVVLEEGEYELRMVAADADRSAPLPGGEGVVVLDTEVTAELVAEGLARDVVRVVQQARREAGLDVADRIRLTLEAGPEVSAAVDTHRDFLAQETLAVSVEFGSVGDRGFTGEAGDGEPVRAAVERA
jgi:isoleucyl-tRNA synthetase